MHIKVVFIMFILVSFSSGAMQQVYSESDTNKTEQWISIPPVGASINDILVKPGEDNTVYIATEKDIFKTINGGLSWRPTNYIGLEKIHVLSVEPSAPEIIYAGGKGGFFKSSNGGKEWVDISGGILKEKEVWAIKIIDASTLYVLTGHGLFKSMNGGRTWGDITPEGSISYFSIDFQSKNKIYAGNYVFGGDSRVFYSDDGGLHWNEIPPFGDKISKRCRGRNIDVHPIDSQLLFGVCEWDGVSGMYLLKSTDAGRTWSDITPKKDNIKNLVDKDSGYVTGSVYFDPSDKNTVYVVGKSYIARDGIYKAGVFKSIDGGQTWTFQGIGAEIYSVHATSISSILYVGTSNGIYKTVNGGKSWRAINIGLPSKLWADNVSSLSLNTDDKQTIYWSRGHDGASIYKTSDGGLSWQKYYEVGYPYLYGMKYPFLFSKEERMTPIFVTANKQAEYIIKPGLVATKKLESSTWSEYKNNISAPLLLILSEQSPQNLYLFGKANSQGSLTLNISDDAGFTWTAINAPISASDVIDITATIKNLQQVIYVATPERIFKTENGGKNWADVSNDFHRSAKSVLSQAKGNAQFVKIVITTIAIDPLSSGTVYVGTNGAGVHKSTDGGKTWKHIVKGLPLPLKNISVNCIVVDPKNLNILYAGTNDGIFKTSDKGATWKTFSHGLPPNEFRNIKAIRLSSTTPQLIVAESSKSIWRLSDSEMNWAKEKWKAMWEEDKSK